MFKSQAKINKKNDDSDWAKIARAPTSMINVSFVFFFLPIVSPLRMSDSISRKIIKMYF